MKQLFTLFLSAFLCAPMYAQDLEVFEKLVYSSESSGSLPYRLLKPLDYNPAKKYPLVIFLHGSGERGNDNQAQLKHGVKVFATKEAREKYQAFVMVPQCPENQRWANGVLDADKTGYEYTGQEPSEPMKLVMEVLQETLQQYSIDQRKVYVAGLSMGAAGTYDLLGRQPDLFAAGVTICGYYDYRMAATIAQTPLWIFHGEDDEVVPVDLSRVMYNTLKMQGAKVKYTEYPAVQHNSWEQACQEPKLLTWLFKQKK